MKYQNFAVIFVLILLPIAIVLENYIQTQTDTLNLATSYQTKLADSTYDAIAAYQMNSLNTQSVTGESVKSYVLASVNTFFTTLATNMGMSSASKNLLLPYIPAILFTTYDGYYIYSPTKTNTVATIPGGDITINEDASDAGQAITTQEGNIVFLESGKERVVRGSAGEKEVDYTGLQNATNAQINSKAGVTINPTQDDVNYNYMVKPFIYYSANYQSNNYNFVASYTLDNYVTLYGEKEKINNRDIGDYVTKEFTKSGYLIDTSQLKINGSLLVKGVKRNDRGYSLTSSNNYDELIDTNTQASRNTTYFKVNVNTDDLNVTKEAYNLINYYNYKESTEYSDGYYISNRIEDSDITDSNEPNLRIQTGDDIIEQTLEIEELIYGENGDNKYAALVNDNTYNQIQVTYKGQNIVDLEAKEYYIKAYFFSEWVQNNLSDVDASSFKNNITDDTKNEFAYNTSLEGKIFKIKGNPENNPESNTSLIAQHKRDIIKNSIQYNLNSAISTYNRSHNGVAEDYRLPVLTETDWDSVLNNVCMVSFMQGLPCGTQFFNDYAVVKSNNNNTTANIENIYFTAEIGDSIDANNSSSQYQYHKIDCEKLSLNAEGKEIYEGDQSSEFKYDAKKVNTRVDDTGSSEKIICFYEDSTNTYYKAEKIDPLKDRTIDNLYIGEKITDTCEVDGTTYPITSDNPSARQVLSLLPNGSDVKYIYDHKNEGCYDCIIGGNYEPKVKYYNGELYATYITEYKEVLLYNDKTYDWFYEDGVIYDGSKYALDPKIPRGNKNVVLGNEGIISEAELNKRRRSLYTYVAKIRNGLYKTNAHVNR